MSRSSPAEPADLRRRILDTAEALLEEAGVAGWSMREVARRAGVTHQAPYHHFADRESIVAELVTQGFDELAGRLARANDRFGSAERPTLRRESALAYVGFALDHPGIFRIMFRPEVCDAGRFPAAQQAGEHAHAELVRLVRLLHGDGAGEAFASGYWAQVHGLACLLVDGPLAMALPTARARREHAREVIALVADGELAR